MSVFNFEGKLGEEKVNFRVTSVAGHVFSCDFPGEYQNWDRDSYELFDAPIKSLATSKGIVKHLERQGQGIDKLILWLDCDREGENICFEVISCVFGKKFVCDEKNNDYKNKVFRARFSAITEKDIKKALQPKNLVKPNLNESLSVDARQELDLKIGVSFSRYQTKYFKNKYVIDAPAEESEQKNDYKKNYREKPKSSVISYGPCQMPTLFFCVERLSFILQFSSEKFYFLSLTLYRENQKCTATWQRKRVFSSRVAQSFLLRATSQQSFANVTNVKASTSKQSRPLPLNTVSLLKAASSKLGMGPQSTMRAAERLYLSGLLSYPRTESNKYPPSFNFKEILSMFRDHPQYGMFCDELLSDKIRYDYSRAKGFDMGDHPPITPCRLDIGMLAALGSEESRLFDFIVRHFLATIAQDAMFSVKKVTLSVGLETFTLSQKKLVKPGFLKVMLDSSKLNSFNSSELAEYGDESEENLDDNEDELEISSNSTIDFAEGDRFYLNGNESSRCEINVKEGKTSPPGLLTESELIGLMEKNRIGTDASISVHIQNIINRNYVALKQVGSKRFLEPTTLGMVLIKGFFRIDYDLCLPKVRAQIEEQCNLIAMGKATKTKVVARSLAMFKKKFRGYQENISMMESLFSENFTKLADKVMELGVDHQHEKGKNMIWSRSGKTRLYLIFLKHPDRLFERSSEKTYFLPRGGAFHQSNGVVCPKDGCGFEITFFSVGNPARTFPICPNCFNSGEEEKDHRNPISMSPHEADHPLVLERKVAERNGMTLMVDCKKSHKFNAVDTEDVFAFPKGVAKKVSLMKKVSEKGEHFVKVEFNMASGIVKKNKFLSDLPDATFTGLLTTEEIWNVLLHRADQRVLDEAKDDTRNEINYAKENETEDANLGKLKPHEGRGKPRGSKRGKQRGNGRGRGGTGRSNARDAIEPDAKPNEGMRDSMKSQRSRGRGRGRGRGSSKANRTNSNANESQNQTNGEEARPSSHRGGRGGSSRGGNRGRGRGGGRGARGRGRGRGGRGRGG